MRRVSTIIALAVLSAPAAADCVILDAPRDNLSPDEQRAALGLMEQALRERGVAIDGDCGVSWYLSHARLGDSVTATLVGSLDSESITVSRPDDLPLAYKRLATALTTGQPVEETATRGTVTEAEADEPARVRAEGLRYLGVGGGAAAHSSLGTDMGILVGLGYRHELDRWAVDVGGTLLVPAEEVYRRALHLGGRMMALRYTSGEADISAYGGLGIGLGIGGGAGLEGSAALGIELLRTTTIRLFTQAELTLPIYDYEPLIERDPAGGYMPLIGLSAGFAFKPRSR